MSLKIYLAKRYMLNTESKAPTPKILSGGFVISVKSFNQSEALRVDALRSQRMKRTPATKAAQQPIAGPNQLLSGRRLRHSGATNT